MLDFKEIESSISQFWGEKEIYRKIVKKNSKGEKFRFLDGPPYTTGSIHIGHAWNKSLKDSILRYKRMNGFNVNDTPGYDMHGLPIEVQVEKNLGIKNKQEILESFGLKNFVQECEKYAVAQLWPMSKDFIRLGIWMDWENPYMTINNSYIEGAWWALKKAWENDYLYKGHKAMTWCARCATALAKHELVYETIVDKSVFVKLKLKGSENSYLIIWTTTPWTLPFNMGVMVNPELDYLKIKVEEEIWIVAKALAGIFMNTLLGKNYKVEEEIKGTELEGLAYEPPFNEEVHEILKDFASSDRMHTVVLSKEYVNTTAGTGLVHMAPSCGPEDYEVGKKYGIPVNFNELNESGVFSLKMGSLSGLTAKKDDEKFIHKLEEKESLVTTTEVEHEYAHCWRCHEPIIYRATEQWFLAVGRLKEQMREENKNILWVPDWAGNKWFDSWLKDLQDWCISRQRFWGIPLPIWECRECKKVILISSANELKELSKTDLKNLHRPWIDEIELDCECGSKSKRVLDVLDVWMDSGASPWASLRKDEWETFDKSEFILEGKDQIRGWFNSLICLSMVARNKNSYKSVYMHGMIMDSQGRKMSKSLKNVISPYEVINKYGADCLRYYMIGAAKPGLDMNYNFKDMEIKFRNLGILWNLQNLVIDLARQNKFGKSLQIKKLDYEEKYILSRLQNTIKEVTANFENYKLNEVPLLIESLFLDLSRIYIQFVREKSNFGSEEEKKAVFFCVYNVLMDSIILFAPIAPFITEKIYQNLKEEFSLKEESIHLNVWPKLNEKFIDKKLEDDFSLAGEVIQSILAIRDKEKIGVRWPLGLSSVVCYDEETKQALYKLKDLIKIQTNIKEISFELEKKTADAIDGVSFVSGYVKLDTTITKELEQEGFSRELIRRIQNLRKQINLKKKDNIQLAINIEVDLGQWKNIILERVGAKRIGFGKIEEEYSHKITGNIKGKEFEIGINIA